MAQQVADQKLQEQIEWCLDYLWDKWSGLSWWAENWSGLEEIDKEVFQLEWAGITEHWLSELQRWDAQGLLTPEQRKRFVRLSRLIVNQRPTLDTLLQDDAA